MLGTPRLVGRQTRHGDQSTEIFLHLQLRTSPTLLSCWRSQGGSLLSLQEFQHDSVKDWMEASWVSVCSWATAVYLLFVFGVRAFMADRWDPGESQLFFFCLQTRYKSSFACCKCSLITATSYTPAVNISIQTSQNSVAINHPQPIRLSDYPH